MYLIICFLVALESMSFRKAFKAINTAHSYKITVSIAVGIQFTLLHDYC